MKKLFLAAVLIAFVLSSCSLIPSNNDQNTNAAVAALQATRDAQNAEATAKAEAPQAAPTEVPPTDAPTIAPPTETATEVPPTPTPTEIPVVKVTTNINANCRFGPDKVFANAELLNAGTSAVVIGQLNTNGQWWKVTTEGGRECWVLGDNVSTSGDISMVPFLASPKTPTPVPPPDWNGYWTIKMARDFNNADSAKVTYQVTFVQTGDQIKYGFALPPYQYVAYLTVSPDGMTATGSLNRSDGWSWVLRFVRVPSNLNQFQGKWYVKNDPGSDGDYCGAKGGESFPDPCRP